MDHQSFGASSIRLSFASPVRLSRKDTRNLFILWLGLEHLHKIVLGRTIPGLRLNLGLARGSSSYTSFSNKLVMQLPQV